jgi:hypothetical protein
MSYRQNIERVPDPVTLIKVIRSELQQREKFAIQEFQKHIIFMWLLEMMSIDKKLNEEYQTLDTFFRNELLSQEELAQMKSIDKCEYRKFSYNRICILLDQMEDWGCFQNKNTFDKIHKQLVKFDDEWKVVKENYYGFKNDRVLDFLEYLLHFYSLISLMGTEMVEHDGWPLCFSLSSFFLVHTFFYCIIKIVNIFREDPFKDFNLEEKTKIILKWKSHP